MHLFCVLFYISILEYCIEKVLIKKGGAKGKGELSELK